MYTHLHVMYSLFVSGGNPTGIFLTNLKKKNPRIPAMKIGAVGTEFHADGQTDMTRLIVTFRNFAKLPKDVSRNSF